MSTRTYRITVVLCAALWLMTGMHVPIVHQITHHGRMPDNFVMVFVALIALGAIASLLALLRAPRPNGGSGAAMG